MRPAMPAAERPLRPRRRHSATIGILVAAILALFVQRSSRRLGRLVNLLIKLPASISSIVLAVAPCAAAGLRS